LKANFLKAFMQEAISANNYRKAI